MASGIDIDGFRKALAPVFADPAVPACMRDAAAVAEAAARCQSVADPDPAHAEAAVRAVAGLPGDLRVPGALLYMSKAGEFWRASASAAKPGIAAAAPADLGMAEGRSHLAAVLERFAWKAADCVLNGRDAEGPEARGGFWREAGRLSREAFVEEALDLPDWLMPPGYVRPAKGADALSEGNSKADRLAKPGELPDFRNCAESALRMCFYDSVCIPVRHLVALAGIWGASGLPFEVGCAAVCDPSLSLEFLRGCGRVPPSLWVPYYAALLGSRATDGRTAAFYAAAVLGGHREKRVPNSVTSPYGTSGEVYLEGEKKRHFFATGQEYYGHRPEIRAAQRRECSLDPEIAELAARHFGRGGAAKDPALLARMCVDEATAFPAVADLGRVGAEPLAALISRALSAGGWNGVPAADCVVAAKAAGLCLGKDAGKFAGYLVEIAGSGYRHTLLGTANQPGHDWYGRAGRLVAEVLGVRAGDGTPALHDGAMNAVKLAVALADCHRWIRSRAKGTLGPEGRRLAGLAA